MEYLFETEVRQLLCRQAITSIIEQMGEVPSELLKALLLAWEYLTCRIWTGVPEECSQTYPIFFIPRQNPPSSDLWIPKSGYYMLDADTQLKRHFMLTAVLQCSLQSCSEGIGASFTTF